MQPQHQRPHTSSFRSARCPLPAVGHAEEPYTI